MLERGAAIGASRLAVAGDSPDFSVVAERMAEMCDLARDYRIAVDIEFMPFRPVKTFADAVQVVRTANRPNAHILVDALHVFRSNSSLDDIQQVDPSCSAPSRSAMRRATRRPPTSWSSRPEQATACRPWRPAIVVADRCPAGRHCGRRRAADRRPVPHLDAPARMQLMVQSTANSTPPGGSHEQSLS
jgi:hypothetical protein